MRIVAQQKKKNPFETKFLCTYQLVLPSALGEEVLDKMHGEVGGGHLGEAKLVRHIQERFYWPGVVQPRHTCSHLWSLVRDPLHPSQPLAWGTQLGLSAAKPSYEV